MTAKILKFAGKNSKFGLQILFVAKIKNKSSKLKSKFSFTSIVKI